MKIDAKGRKIYQTSEQVRNRVLTYYREHRDEILKRRRELKQINKEQQQRNRQRWALRNRERLREHQHRFAEKRRKQKDAQERTT